MKAVVAPTRAAKRAIFDARRRQPSARYYTIFDGDAAEVDVCEDAIQEVNASEVGAPERAADKDTVCNRHAFPVRVGDQAAVALQVPNSYIGIFRIETIDVSVVGLEVTVVYLVYTEYVCNTTYLRYGMSQLTKNSPVRSGTIGIRTAIAWTG
jgi:hypothetical protein